MVAGARPRGDLQPDKRGGNVRSHRIDEYRDLILGWIEEKHDLTLAELAERLDKAMGYRPQPSVPEIRRQLVRTTFGSRIRCPCCRALFSRYPRL
ncbi:hypothetical protein [Azospirillum sp. TSH100]|uniref:hypothetical protein n=1 Tax=Azospirillum sp. TSH100 TaxID=652764 RepID=UPI0010A9DB77|nr:hypothetical protein [Azospirillum sp. TSH100]QCG89109.1 hypothetical protein E6C72_14945 [Azospirillum sp. TSH100]